MSRPFYLQSLGDEWFPEVPHLHGTMLEGGRICIEAAYDAVVGFEFIQDLARPVAVLETKRVSPSPAPR